LRSAGRLRAGATGNGGCRVAAQGLFFKPQGFDPVTHISAELDEVVLVDPSRAARIV